MRQEDIQLASAKDLKTRFQIPILYCSSLNDAPVVDTLREIKPDLVVFTGGEIIRSEVLENSGAGVLNCHMGVLPKYRGMDLIEWAVLENDFEQIGITVHLMDRGIDTGDILHVEKIKIEKNESLKELRERFDAIMCRQMIRTCLEYLNENVSRIEQRKEDGKQYFNVHPRLMEIAEAKLRRKQAETLDGPVGDLQS